MMQLKLRNLATAQMLMTFSEAILSLLICYKLLFSFLWYFVLLKYTVLLLTLRSSMRCADTTKF